MTTSLEQPSFHYAPGEHKTITITGSLYPDDVFDPYAEHFRDGPVEAWPLEPSPDHPDFYATKATTLAKDTSIRSLSIVATSAGTIPALRTLELIKHDSTHKKATEVVLIDPYLGDNWKSDREKKRPPLSTDAASRILGGLVRHFPELPLDRLHRQIDFLANGEGAAEEFKLPESLENIADAGLLIESSRDTTRHPTAREFLLKAVRNLQIATVEAGHAKILKLPTEKTSDNGTWKRYIPPIANYFRNSQRN